MAQLRNYTDLVGKYDILCTKDRTVANHPGNLRFRSKIEQMAYDYEKARNTFQKAEITNQIIQELREPQEGVGKLSPCRFLGYHNKTNTWNEIAPQLVRDKISHALRFVIQRRQRRHRQQELKLPKQKWRLACKEIRRHEDPLNQTSDATSSSSLLLYRNTPKRTHVPTAEEEQCISRPSSGGWERQNSPASSSSSCSRRANLSTAPPSPRCGNNAATTVPNDHKTNRKIQQNYVHHAKNSHSLPDNHNYANTCCSTTAVTGPILSHHRGVVSPSSTRTQEPHQERESQSWMFYYHYRNTQDWRPSSSIPVGGQQLRHDHYYYFPQHQQQYPAMVLVPPSPPPPPPPSYQQFVDCRGYGRFQNRHTNDPSTILLPRSTGYAYPNVGGNRILHSPEMEDHGWGPRHDADKKNHPKKQTCSSVSMPQYTRRAMISFDKDDKRNQNEDLFHPVPFASPVGGTSVCHGSHDNHDHDDDDNSNNYHWTLLQDAADFLLENV